MRLGLSSSMRFQRCARIILRHSFQMIPLSRAFAALLSRRVNGVLNRSASRIRLTVLLTQFGQVLQSIAHRTRTHGLTQLHLACAVDTEATIAKCAYSYVCLSICDTTDGARSTQCAAHTSNRKKRAQSPKKTFYSLYVSAVCR